MSNFHPIEDVGLASEAQLHVGENLNIGGVALNPFSMGKTLDVRI